MEEFVEFVKCWKWYLLQDDFFKFQAQGLKFWNIKTNWIGIYALKISLIFFQRNRNCFTSGFSTSRIIWYNNENLTTIDQWKNLINKIVIKLKGNGNENFTIYRRRISDLFKVGKGITNMVVQHKRNWPDQGFGL